MKALPARDSFPLSALVSVWSETTGARTLWAPAEAMEELEGLGRRAECVLELAFKDLGVLWDSPSDDARPVNGAVKAKIQRVHSAKDAA